MDYRSQGDTRLTINGSRHYKTPYGSLPSVTTILSETSGSKAALERWAKKNPGGREAAAARGKAEAKKAAAARRKAAAREEAARRARAAAKAKAAAQQEAEAREREEMKRKQIEKEKQHVRLTRRSLLARLRRSEMTRTDFENEMNDARDTLNEHEIKWAALQKAGTK